MTDEEKRILEQFIDNEHGESEGIPGTGIALAVAICAVAWLCIYAVVKWWA